MAERVEMQGFVGAVGPRVRVLDAGHEDLRIGEPDAQILVTGVCLLYTSDAADE